MKIEIEESALDSLKAMVQKLQDERDMLLAELQRIAEVCEDHPAYLHGATDKEAEIEGGDATMITLDIGRPARSAIAACTETKQVMAEK